MTRDTVDVNDPRPIIRGEPLLIAFQLCERFCQRYTPTWRQHSYPEWFEYLAREYQKFDHHYGIGHWIGELALRAPCRSAVDSTFSEVKRNDLIFVIEDVVERAMKATTESPSSVSYLTTHDRELLSTLLTNFFLAVSLGEFTRRDLSLPMPNT